MNKPNKQLIRFTLILTSAIVCMIEAPAILAAEPVYNGKTLSEWLVETDRGARREAIQHIGTNGIPTLLDIVGVKEWTRKRVVGKLKNKNLQQLFCKKESNLDDLRDLGVSGFVILGTNAAPAFPRLVKLLDDPETCYQAARALLKVSSEGFAVLTNALAKQDASTRNDMVWTIGHEGGADKETITRLLILSLKDPNWPVRGNAAEFLAGKDAALAVPALIPMLDDSEYYPRARAAIALASFGPAAKSAAPKLLSVYTNVIVGPDRKLAFDLGGSLLDALRKIDRETAGRAEEFLVNSGPLNDARFGYTRTMLTNGLELITGGYIHIDIPTATNRDLSTTELLDPKTGIWRMTGEMNTARYGHKATLLSDGKVLVEGGYHLRHQGLSSKELYDPTTGTWTVVTNK
jgi:hypothetical protein